MIDLERLKSNEFREQCGFLGLGTIETALNIMAQQPEVEIARRSLTSDDFPKIEEFIIALLAENFDSEYQFSYEFTLVALAIILTEYESSIAEKYLTDLAELKISNLPYSSRIARKLEEMRDELSSTKNKVRIKWNDAIFLPVNELHHVVKNTTDCFRENFIVIAAEVNGNQITLVADDFCEYTFDKNLFKDTPKAKVNFAKPYLTDYGQTLGFGQFGTWEVAVDDLIKDLLAET